MSALIGIDWGSTNLRAYRFDGDGRVVERRAVPHGAASFAPDGFARALGETLAG